MNEVEVAMEEKTFNEFRRKVREAGPRGGSALGSDRKTAAQPAFLRPAQRSGEGRMHSEIRI